MFSIIFKVRLAPAYVWFTPGVECHVAVQNRHIRLLSSMIFCKIKHFRPHVWLCRSRAGDKRQHVAQNSSFDRGHGHFLNFSNLGEQWFCRQGIFSKVWTITLNAHILQRQPAGNGQVQRRAIVNIEAETSFRPLLSPRIGLFHWTPIAVHHNGMGAAESFLLHQCWGRFQAIQIVVWSEIKSKLQLWLFDFWLTGITFRICFFSPSSPEMKNQR